MTIAYRAENDTHLLEVIYDEYPENPRKSWDHTCEMVCWHNRYDLGDRMLRNPDKEDINELIDEHKESHWIYPLYLMDHSGVSMSISSASFQMADSAGWDWGLVGVMFAPKSEFPNEDDALKRAKAEVAEYSAYLEGDVVGWRLEAKTVCDHGDEHPDTLESCWGYYGMSLNDLKQEILGAIGDEYKELVEALD